MTRAKIKIVDDARLREELDREYETSSQVQLCRYALLLASRILAMVNDPALDNDTVKEGFLINEQWQKGNASVHDVRQVCFKIHQLAKTSEDMTVSTALRVAGHAAATAHMREHAMVASDYAVKVINLLYPDRMDMVETERLWQIKQLKDVKTSG
ncbi:MAG: hypothetical protein IKE36_01070 [Solobacterium sp.]|nr:hypothetical protein [Solobacterium sp.]